MNRLFKNLALLTLVALSTACDDDPFALTWSNNADTATVYSLARPETHLVSGFNFVSRSVVRIDAPNAGDAWEWALDTQDGVLVMLPPRALGVISTAGIIPIPGENFEDVAEAPEDSTLYIRDIPVPATLGTVFVVRTHQQVNSFGQRCIYYGKMEPLVLDVELGFMEFQFDANPICNERGLIAN